MNHPGSTEILMTEDEDTDDLNASGSGRRLTDEEFATARELYELDKAGITELSKEFGVSRQALTKRFQNAGIVRGSKLRAQERAAEDAKRATVERYADRRAEWIEETRIQGLNSLKQARLIAQKIVVDQVKASKPLGEVDDDLKAIGRLNKLLVDNIGKALEILQADEHIDEADLPTLTIEDLTDQDILDHHKSTGALDENATLEDINLEIT